MDKESFDILLEDLDWKYTYQDENGLIYYKVDETIFCEGIACYELPNIKYKVYGKSRDQFNIDVKLNKNII